MNHSSETGPGHPQQAIETNSNSSVELKGVEQSIPVAFERIVAEYPGRIAVKAGNVTLTYDELNQAANRVAREIIRRGGQGNEPIAMLLDHAAPTITAIVGALKAGKIYVPMDPSFPYARISYVLEDTQARLIVTNNENLSLANDLARDKCPLVNLDEIDTGISRENLGLSLSPESFAYILYTSGSTGQPKGVVQDHRNVLQVIKRYTNGLGVRPDDRLTLFSSFSTTTSVANIFGGLLNGASLYPFDLKDDGLAKLAAWLVQEEITIFHSFPTLFRHFVNSLTGDENFSNLRLVRLSGEPVYKKDVEEFKKHFSPHCILVNGYGTSEMSAVCEYRVDHNTELSDANVPVGFPLCETDVLILDDAGEEVGLNCIGEIAIKSRYLFLGYWQRPELTGLAFIDDPAGGSERIYRTGDLGYMQEGGCLVHVGRKDFQVKINGYRVEVAEIETALLDFVGIKEVAVVTAEESPGGDRRLIAYIVSRQRLTRATTELRNYLKEQLPDYMVPSAFVFLDALPLTPNGKVDRSTLPAPDRSRPDLESPFVAPSTPVEQALATIWAEVLKLEKVGIHDNFFDLGGHSLLAIQVVSRVREAFHVELPLRAMFETPTVAGLDGEILQAEATKTAPQEMTEMLADLESLSDEDAERLLAQESSKKDLKVNK
ncbi:MAG TPA: non-ribosomal peptide synthetase [Candidatus Binatia bacterium]|jgi:amino acid adenylation domain-containing protein|nr:non-ribosomal peptide synthetase [Candidatus Binatia bacterium]